MNTNKILVQKLWLYGDVDKTSFISYISLPDQNLVITIIGRITVVFMFMFCPTIASMILAPHRNTSSVNIFDIAFTVMGQNKHFHKLWTQFVEPSNSSIVGHQRSSCHCRERHWTSWSLSSECCWYSSGYFYKFWPPYDWQSPGVLSGCSGLGGCTTGGRRYTWPQRGWVRGGTSPGTVPLSGSSVYWDWPTVATWWIDNFLKSMYTLKISF